MKKLNGIILLLALLLCVPSTALPVSAEADLEIRHLQISITEDENAGLTTVPAAQLDGAYPGDITYCDVTNVCILVAGEEKPLEDAIREGDISTYEMVADAQLDAQAGICRELAYTKNGLTYFTYRYPEYDLMTAHDIYETPDGKEHLIRFFGVLKTGSKLTIEHPDEASPYGYMIDREDWGITLQAKSVTPTGLTLSCKQSGGQQLGALAIVDYVIYRNAEDGARTPLDRLDDSAREVPIATIPENQESEITLDWAALYGTLPSGSYSIRLRMKDFFEPSAATGMIKDFTDEQPYQVNFTLSE